MTISYKEMHREILRIAVPSIFTNITIPLLSLVDLTIVGHLQHSAAIGAIAVGGLIFNMIYWLFNFLRMGSSGLTAQAYGAGMEQETRRVLRMGLTVATVSGLVIILCSPLMEWLAYRIIAPTDEVWQLAVMYFRVRVWAAPAVLGLFAMSGWLVGMQNARFPLYIAVIQNLTNIAASLLMVFVFHRGIEGVAAGTVVAGYTGFAVALFMCRRQQRLAQAHLAEPLTPSSYQPVTYRRFFTVNRDIFLRMICIITVTTAFTSYGARMGELTLAANTLLIQLFTLFSYFFDGFSLAGEALVGKAVGAGRSPHATVVRLFGWGLAVVVLFTLLYGWIGKNIVGLLTDDVEVITQAVRYLKWTVCIPLCGMAAFMWDGVFIGLTATRAMFLSLLIGTVVFFASKIALTAGLSDPCDALWVSFNIYLVARGVVLTVLYCRSRPRLTP